MTPIAARRPEARTLERAGKLEANLAELQAKVGAMTEALVGPLPPGSSGEMTWVDTFKALGTDVLRAAIELNAVLPMRGDLAMGLERASGMFSDEAGKLTLEELSLVRLASPEGKGLEPAFRKSAEEIGAARDALASTLVEWK